MTEIEYVGDDKDDEDDDMEEIAERYVDNPVFKDEVDKALGVTRQNIPEMTICSTMFCYNDAEETNDPANPPFCHRCKEKANKSA